jgi:hypothetical protein
MLIVPLETTRSVFGTHTFISQILQSLNFFSFFLQLENGDIICYQKSSKPWKLRTHPSVQSFLEHVHALKVAVFVLTLPSYPVFLL